MKRQNVILWCVGVVALVAVVALFRDRVHFDWAVFWQQLRYVSLGHIAAGIVLIYAT